MYISPASFFNWKDPRIIVDIRPSGSFAKGSFSGAKSIPKENFEELITDQITELINRYKTEL